MTEKSLHITLVLTILLVFGCGPEQKDQPAKPSIEGLKITDLIPKDAPKMPTEIQISVFIYEMPAAKSSVLTEIYKSLPSDFLNFSSQKAFKANGFETGFGYDQIWPQISLTLARAGAQQVKTENLLFMDMASNDVVIGESPAGKTYYLHKRSGQSETLTMRNGQLSWRVKARALPEKEGTALVQIVPQDKEYVSSAIKKLPGFERTGENVYFDMSIKAYMTEGNFIIMGPSVEELAQVTLSDFFFRRTGDIITPDIKEDQEPDEQGQVYYKIEKNIPLIRLYVFGCMRISS